MSIKYVLVRGSFPEGVTDVVGPFDTPRDVHAFWDASRLDYYLGEDPNEKDIHQVDASPRAWGEGGTVDVFLNDRGGVAGVYGPYDRAFPFAKIWAVSCVIESPQDFARRMRGADEA